MLGGTAQSAAETSQGEKPGVFDAQGMIGKQFTGTCHETGSARASELTGEH